MAVRLKDATGKVVAEFDHEPTQDEINAAIGGGMPEVGGISDQEWEKMRRSVGIEPTPTAGAPKEEMVPPQKSWFDSLQMSNVEEGRKPVQPHEIPNWIKAGGAAVAEVSSIPFQAINEALGTPGGPGAVEEATRAAFPRGKEFEEQPKKPTPTTFMEGVRGGVMEIPEAIGEQLRALHKEHPQAAEYVSAAARPAARAALQLPIDPRTWLLPFMGVSAISRLVGAGFTLDMLLGGAEEQKRAQKLLLSEGMTPDAVEALSASLLSYAGAGLVAKGGLDAEMLNRRAQGKPYIDPKTGHVMWPKAGPKEGVVEPPAGLPEGETKPPQTSPEDVVDAEVIRREGVSEPAYQLPEHAGGPYAMGPGMPPGTVAAETGNYPPGPPSRLEPIEPEITGPPAVIEEPPVPTPPEASPALKAAITRFRGNSPNFLRWLNRLEKAAKVTRDPGALALVAEAKKWQAWQVVMQAQGGFAAGLEGPGVERAAPGAPAGAGGPVPTPVVPPTTPPPGPGQPFQIQPPQAAPPAPPAGVAPQPQEEQAPPPPAAAPGVSPTEEMQPPPAALAPPTPPAEAAPPPPPAPPQEEMAPPPAALEAPPAAGPRPERFRASIDIPATPEGLAEFRPIAEKLAAHGGLDEIYHDDQQRTIETAKVLQEVMPGATLHDVGTAGQSQALGKWEGQPVDEKALATMRHLVENPDVVPSDRSPDSTRDGESFNQYLDRFLPLVDALKKKAEAEGKAIGLVTHNRNIQTINARLAEAGAKNLYGKRVDESVMDQPGPEVGTVNKVIDHATEDWSEKKITPGLYLIRHARTAFNPPPEGLPPTAPEAPPEQPPSPLPEPPAPAGPPPETGVIPATEETATQALAAKHPLVQIYRENPKAIELASFEGELTPTEARFLAEAEPGLMEYPWMQRALAAGKNVMTEPPLAPSLDPVVAGWMDDIAKLEEQRKGVPAGPEHYKEREHLRNAITAIKQKMDRYEKKQNKPAVENTFSLIEGSPVSALPKGDADFFAGLLPKTFESNAVALPPSRPAGWTGEMEGALKLMQVDAAVRRATGKGANKAQRQKMDVLQAAIANNLHQNFTPEQIAQAKTVINQALKMDHLGDLLKPGVEVPGRHLRLGIGGPRVKVVEVLPSGIDFKVQGSAGEIQTVNIDALTGKNYQPYEQMSADATLDVATTLYEKSVAGTRHGELGAIRPGALLGLLGAAAATPLAIAFPGETMGVALLAGIGAAAWQGKLGPASVAAWALARASAAGRLSVAVLNGAAAIGRIGLGALADGAWIVGSMLVPGRKSAEARADAIERGKAAIKTLNIPKGLHEVVIGALAAAQYDPVAWDRISKMDPVIAAKIQGYMNEHLSEDFAWKDIMQFAGVPAADAERFHHFTQGHIDPKTVERIGELPASLVSSMLVFNAAVDRVTRNAYVSIALAPLLKKYGLDSLAQLRDHVWGTDAKGNHYLKIPMEEYKKVEEAIDTAVTGAMNYSGGLTAEKVHMWRWMEPIVRGVSAMPLPVAMTLSPQIALFANYALVNVPEVMLQHSPLFFMAPRFRASMEIGKIRDAAYAAQAEMKLLDEEVRAAKEFAKAEAKRLAPVKKEKGLGAYTLAMSEAEEWVDEALAARKERGPELLERIREYRKRRRSRYYSKQQLYGAFFTSGMFLMALSLAYRLMRGEDGTAPTEIRKDKNPDGTTTVVDVKRIAGPLTLPWWMGDMAGRMFINQQDPTKYPNITQWTRFPDMYGGLKEAMGYRQSPMDALVEDLDLRSAEGVDKALRTITTQVGNLYANFGGWMHDIYNVGVAASGSTPPFYQDPLIEPTAMPPIPVGTPPGKIAEILGKREIGALERTMAPDWLKDLQAKMGIPEKERVHIAAAWDKMLMARRPLQRSPLSWFFTMREQSALTRFINNVEGEKLSDILPTRTGVEWYDEVVNKKMVDLARENDLFGFLEDERIPPEVRYQGLVDRMQDYRLRAHTAAKRYADEYNLLLPNAATFAEASRREDLRMQDPDFLVNKALRKGMKFDYNLTPAEQMMQAQSQAGMVEDLEINLPPYELEGPPVQ